MILNIKVAVKLDLISPPQRIAQLHQRIKRRLKNWFSVQGIELIQSSDAPALVTVLDQRTSISTDIKRDLGSKGLLNENLNTKNLHYIFVSDITGRDIMLLIITASIKAPPKPNINDDRVKSISFLLVDDQYSNILDCPHNEETFNEIKLFLDLDE